MTCSASRPASRMELQAVQGLVHLLALAIDHDPREDLIDVRELAYFTMVFFLVLRGEQRLRVDADVQASLPGPLKGTLELRLRVRLVDEDRMLDERQILRPRGIDESRAMRFGKSDGN